MRKVLVTGSRNLEYGARVDLALWAQARLAGGLDQLQVIVGDCPTGADLHAREFCARHKVYLWTFVANWNKHGKAAGPIRNAEMVAGGADVCLAFPREGSKGTIDCIQRAKAAGIPVIQG